MRSTEPDQPLHPDDMPPELRAALAKMSERGPVIDLGTGDVVARDGQLVEHITCSTTSCEATAPRPDDGQWHHLHDAGWRWVGDPGERPLRLAPRAKVYSCPACPPVV